MGIVLRVLNGIVCSEDLLAVLKEVLTRPMSGDVKMDSSCGPHNARTNFEQPNTDGIRTGLRQSGVGQDGSAKVSHQQSRDGVQLKPDRIGTKAMTAQAVGI